MTQLTLSMLLKADGAPAAKAAIQDVAKANEALGAATTKGAAADRAAASAKQANAQANRSLATSSNAAAGATGNLVANFNDLFMMIGAGQNPLQTAIQQGTQITQVIGPMGAAGAARALGTAFMSMLSPINLITLGAIAVGSAMIQWLTTADDDAAAVTQELERQKDALQGVIEETERLRLARGMSLSGAQTQDEQLLLEANNQLMAQRKAIQAELNYLQIQDAEGVSEVAAQKWLQLSAELEVVDARLEANRAGLAGLQANREATAATEANRKAAQDLKVTVDAVAAAIARAAAGDLSGPFVRAQGAANALLGIANNILAAMGQAAAERAAYGESVGGGRGVGPQGPALDPYGFRAQLARDQRAKPSARGGRGGGGGGGGGGAVRDEANALQELITSLEGEIEALRTQDPIQQEMLKHREALTGATEAERKKVEELIATREREAMLVEGAKKRAEFFEQLGNNALESLIVKGESFNDVLKNIISSLAQAIIQAALFGSGPFASMFGGTGIMEMIFPALGAGKAAGGQVHGPGDGTKDTFLTPTANGEYIVNAKATARNLHLLEAINSGAQITAGRAAGGMVGSGPRAAGSWGGGSAPGTIVIDMRGARGNREIEEIAYAATRKGLELYDREALPRSVRRVSADGKRVN